MEHKYYDVALTVWIPDTDDSNGPSKQDIHDAIKQAIENSGCEVARLTVLDY